MDGGEVMDAQQPPTIIEIPVPSEKHDLKKELIEHVARLLCRADGKNPDQDIRASEDGTRFLALHLPYPDNLQWSRYRDKAEARLKEIFGTVPANHHQSDER
jgi:hypothetical protein